MYPLANEKQMPIWSFTQERLDRLKDLLIKKQTEHDELEAKSEKSLWCADLDEFELEWENQLRLDSEITTSIRRMGRRVSKKIGAGRGRNAKNDDDYAPTAKSRATAKPTAAKVTKVTKTAEVPPKTHQAFAAKFARKKSLDGADDDSDAFSDDDFAALKSKPSKRATAPVAPEPTAVAEDLDDSDPDEVVAPTPARSRRAAAAKTKSWIIDDDDFKSSDEDDDKMLGDVGALVKGIPGASVDSGDNKTGRLSLFAMSRPESNPGASATVKVKSKPSKTFDFDSQDDTNYEMLAKSSPHKSPFTRNEVDSFLSDDDMAVSKPAVKASALPKAKKSASPSEQPKPAVKKGRVRSAGVKSNDKVEAPTVKPAPKKKAAAAPAKTVQLSPAAKLYAKKKDADKLKPKKDEFDENSDEDEDMVEAEAPAPRPAARARPGRAAAAKKKPVYVIDDDDDDEDEVEEEVEEDAMELDQEDDGGQDEESDAFAMDDSE